jgi:DNA-binding CsgD family transcriptional regulator/tetratricopeptide (TPR) repeat protein
VLVTGDAGVGKTRLVHQACSAGAGLLVLSGACLPLTTLTVPLLPLRTALRALPAGARPALEAGPGGTTEAAQAFDAWLEARCEEQPVVLVVDDVQWADAATLDVLLWVLAGLGPRRLAVLLTLRRGEVGAGHRLQRWLADTRRLPGFSELGLEPLDLEGTRAQLAGVLGGIPHDALVRQVFARTAGNAYLNRLLVTGLPANATSLGEGALRDDLTTAVLRRWHELSPAARELARVVAVSSRVARGRDLAYAAQLAGVGDPEPLLRECLDAEVLEPQQQDGYWFHHPLQAEALEASLAPPERRRLHAAFATLLEQDADSATDLAIQILVADHHHRADDLDAALSWSLRAAATAEAVGDDGEAVRLLRRVLELRRRLGEDARDGDLPLLLRQRAAAARVGDFGEELAAVEAILDLGEVDPLLASELVVRRGHLRFSTGAGFLDLADNERALDLASGAPGSWQCAFALAECAHAALWADDPRGPALTAEAVTRARASGHPRALAYALAAGAMCATFEGRQDEGVVLAREAVECAGRARDGWAFGHATLWEANATAATTSPASTDVLRRRRVQLRALGVAHPFVAWLAVVEAEGRLLSGEWETCVRLLREALGSTPGALVDVAGRLTAAQLAARQGRPAEARGHLDRADELFAQTSTFLPFPFDATRALVSLAEGDSRGCVSAALAGTATPGVPPTMCEWLLPLAIRGLADLAQARRDAGSGVEDLLDEALDLERRFPHVIRDSAFGDDYERQLRSLDALYRAELARLRVAEDRASAWTTAADALCGVLPWEECYARWRSAEALFQQGSAHRSEAVDALRVAHGLAEGLGAAPDLAQIEALARSARVPLGAPVLLPQPDSASPVGLTTREEEVLAHVVAGRTYGEIARALVVSEKTVSSHVSHLLAKTGTANRVDLARWATRRGAGG